VIVGPKKGCVGFVGSESKRRAVAIDYPRSGGA
jgi:hypothetical protein